MAGFDLSSFEQRIHYLETARRGDVRTPYERDRARIIHSAAFRRLQGKTQVMGVSEGDFHRTRLTHSIEAAQIGQGIVHTLERTLGDDSLKSYLPPTALIEAACYAHDLGHPPFGHGGERALHSKMQSYGGFEGNGQTLRILTRLEKYDKKNNGINPTARLVLAILKYAVPYSRYPAAVTIQDPPKCYFDTEADIVESATASFSANDASKFSTIATKGYKPATPFKTLDASIMEMADDIAFAVHDLEDIVARKLVERDEVQAAIKKAFADANASIKSADSELTLAEVEGGLFSAGSRGRKQIISRLVNLFISSANKYRGWLRTSLARLECISRA